MILRANDRTSEELLSLVYDDLRRLAAMVPPGGGQTYAMFNNIPRAADARRFAAMLRRGRGRA